MGSTVSWIAFTPVKGLRLQHRIEVQLTEAGVPGDRSFFLVDQLGAMVSATRLGPLVTVVAAHDERAERLALLLPDGEEVAGSIELGEPEDVRFHSLTLRVRPVLGAFSATLSERCGVPLRLFASPPERPSVDRGRDGAVTLLSVASLERLRLEAQASKPMDARRFRMTFGVDGLAAHEEDGWINRAIRVGDAVLHVTGNVGRCALTTRNAETGVVDLKTLHHLSSYRGETKETEPLPFGVHARVVQPGRVRVGDTVTLA